MEARLQAEPISQRIARRQKTQARGERLGAPSRAASSLPSPGGLVEAL